MVTATYSGNVETSSLSIRFSDRVGSQTPAQYSFSITDEFAGHTYGSVTNLSLLSTLDNATIQASVLAALSTGISSLAGTISSLDINEFGVTFSEDQLIITNSQGRALAVEEYSSTHGFMTVTPINEPGLHKFWQVKMHIIQRLEYSIKYFDFWPGFVRRQYKPFHVQFRWSFKLRSINYQRQCKLRAVLLTEYICIGCSGSTRNRYRRVSRYNDP